MQNQDSNGLIDILQERLSNPALFTFAWVYVAYNWQAFGWFLFEPLMFSLKLEKFQDTNIEISFGWPLLISIIVIVVGHGLSNFAEFCKRAWDQLLAYILKRLNWKEFVEANVYYELQDKHAQLQAQYRTIQLELDRSVNMPKVSTEADLNINESTDDTVNKSNEQQLDLEVADTVDEINKQMELSHNIMEPALNSGIIEAPLEVISGLGESDESTTIAPKEDETLKNERSLIKSIKGPNNKEFKDYNRYDVDINSIIPIKIIFDEMSGDKTVSVDVHYQGDDTVKSLLTKSLRELGENEIEINVPVELSPSTVDISIDEPSVIDSSRNVVLDRKIIFLYPTYFT